MDGETRARRLRELAGLFFKLGVIGFGGPAAHIAMMEDEVVTRRQWMTREHFLDLVGATNLIPGPNSTEMTMHVGYQRAGWAGLLTAGTSFILPAALSVGLLAWLYVAYGDLPEVEPFLVGIKPAVLAVILGALWRLGRKAVKSWLLALIGAGVVTALLLGVNQVTALLAGGVAGAVILILVSRGTTPPAARVPEDRPAASEAGPSTPESPAPDLRLLLPLAPLPLGGVSLGGVSLLVNFSLVKLALFFLKVGLILYGSGYVLIAFLEADLVQRFGWLTEEELLDAIAIGQFTPGPVLTTATFIGYILGGWSGAVVATVCIFLPSFFFVAALNPLIPRMRASRWAGAFLDAVNVSAVALMLVVTLMLARSSLVDVVSWAIFLVAAVAVVRFRVNAAFLVVFGMLTGWAFG